MRAIYTDPRFSKAMGVGTDHPRLQERRTTEDASSLSNMDPPQHTRIRRLTLSAFTRSRIAAMRTWIEPLADELLDAMVAEGPGADFETHYAWTLPLHVVTRILGIPKEEVYTYKGWIDTMMSMEAWGEQKQEAYGKVTEYINRLIAERREQSTDDLLSIMVRARDEDDQLTEAELFHLSLALFLAGFETTAAQLGSTVCTLMTHRHLWQELLDDPSLLPAAMEELWRWVPSFRYGMPRPRWAVEDVELSGGVVIPKGEAADARAPGRQPRRVRLSPTAGSWTSTGRSPSRTSPWPSARTTAWGRTWPTWRSRSPCRGCCSASRTWSSPSLRRRSSGRRRPSCAAPRSCRCAGEDVLPAGARPLDGGRQVSLH